MTLSSKIRLILWILLLVIVGTGLGLWWSLPGMVEKRLPFYAQEAGIKDINLEVRNISLFRADLGSVVLGDPKAPGLTIATVQVDYSPWDLIHKKIRSVKVAGVQAYTELDGSKLSLRGVEIPASKAQDKSSAAVVLPENLPVDVSSLILDSAIINLKWNGGTYQVPLDFQAVQTDPGVFSCGLTVHTRGQAVNCGIKADLPGQKIEISLGSEILETGRFGDLINRFTGLIVNGDVNFSGSGGWTGKGLEPAAGSLSFARGEVLSGPVRLVSPKDNPLTAKISFKPYQADITLENIHISDPVGVEIPAVQTSIAMSENGLSASGGFSYQVRALPNLPFSMENPAQADVKFKAEQSKDGAISLAMENYPPQKDIVLIHEAAIVYLAQPVWKIQGSAKPRDKLNVDFSLALPVISIETGSAQARIPGLTCTGKLTLASGQGPVVTVETQFKDGKAWGIDPSFQVNGIRATMPFTYPSQTDRGDLSISSVRFGGKDIGSVAMTMERKDTHISLKGTHSDRLVPGLTANFSGKAGLDERGVFQLNSNFGVEEFQISGLDLSRFAKELKGYTFDGILTTKGFASFENGELETGMELNLTKGKIQAPEYQMEMNGINLSVVMEDLVAVRSAPRQVFSFESAKAGNIKLDNGRVEFIVESPESFFVERSSFKWCKGRVFIPAIHLKAGVSDYELLLFCDRLDFVELLKQLGAPSANGSGTMNGIVPVRITDGHFRFDEGHLYSTPGDGGALKIKGSDDFMNGMNAGTPQAGQIALAKLALEDYQYEWAKLEINSEDENLVLKLQLDGKPTGPLPLVPDPKTGNFQRVKDPALGATFQGIKLNLNIKLPLDLILKYGIKLKDYF